MLKSAQHSLWYLISIEVNKFWKELRRMEVKRAYIYSALDKHKLPTEQLAHLHKSPAEKALVVIKFLKFSSDETLQSFKTNDRYQTIMLLQRVVDKEDLANKAHTKIDALQKEIKEMYALLKPLMEKGLPYFWDDQNRLLKKEQYENLIVARRNDHAKFDDLEGNLMGEVLVVKLGDIFDLLNMAKRIKLPSLEVEEYINLVLLAIHMKDLMLPNRNQFKELSKLVAKPIGLIPLTL